MLTNRYTAKLNEMQQKINTKKRYTIIEDINLSLNKIHQMVEPQINLKKFQPATDYVNQYISHTSIWNLKFKVNLESLEVALLQILHLQFIFDIESKNAFHEEKKLFAEQLERFNSVNTYSDEHIEKRKITMYKEIQKRISSKDI